MGKRYISQSGRTSRAFRAYIDLMDTADWLREEMSRQLDSFDLTMPQFRVLETLYNQGPQHQQELSRKFRCGKQNIASVLERLVEMGWIRRKNSSLPRTSAAHWVNPAGASSKDRPARGRRIVRVMLSPEGRKVFAHVFQKHAKVVKAEMRALEGREQQTLSRLCEKLREGDVVKFVREVKRRDWMEAAD